MTPEAGKRIDSASRVIKALPQIIYQAYLNPDWLASWLPPRGMKARVDEFDPRAGGTYRIVLTYDDPNHVAPGKSSAHGDVVRGRFLELVPGERIVQLVEFESDDPAFAGEMRMTWLLVPVPGGTNVIIRGENVPPGIRAEDHEAGFTSTLENLAAFVERHEP
jgi:uncharacterized protein YndB with AHSA1/START domain